jgi:pimeloyl-ACP methyl ester carboxylesterase
MTVPLDDDEPDGDVIEIAVARHRAADPDSRIGVLISNPGGLGAGETFIGMFADQVFPTEIVDRFDIVGFDPRGTGDSTPVRCDVPTTEIYHLDPTPDDFADAARREVEAMAMATRASDRAVTCSPTWARPPPSATSTDCASRSERA